MRSKKQTQAAKQNIKKAQKAWQTLSHHERTLAQPQGKDRAKVGTTGEGRYYRIIVRPKNEFKKFRFQDVGDPGHIQRLAGKRNSNNWDTHAWLIEKSDAIVENGKLVAKTKDVEDLLKELGSEPKHLKGDIFEAKDRPNIPEKDKPTEAQKKAQKKNIKKAQEVRKN